MAEMTEGSDNVFRDVGFSEQEAEASLAKARLVLAIQRIMEAEGWTQGETAKKIGVRQPRLSTMLRGDYRNISEAKLLDCLMRLGCDVQISIKRRPAKARAFPGHGQLRIVGA